MNSSAVVSGTVFVLGAGVDCALGLPIMNNLFKRLHEFSENKDTGKVIDSALRGKAPYLQFRLKNYAEAEGENIGAKLLGTHSHLLEKLIPALKKFPDQGNDRITAVLDMLMRLDKIRGENLLGVDTTATFAKMGGNTFPGSHGTLLNEQHMLLNPVARQAMQSVFVTAVENITLSPEEKAAFAEVVTVLLNFEEMLGNFFRGFFVSNPADQKRYFYLAWMFWAYIKLLAEDGLKKRAQSFYSTLSEVAGKDDIITFNYTNFFCDNTRPSLGYFHGDFASYIHFADRHYDTVDPKFLRAKTPQAIADFINEMPVDWTTQPPTVGIPALMPPVSMKPLICAEYLEKWHWCSERIKSASVIIVIGYSFAAVDEHFNDLLRKGNRTAPVVIINPDLNSTTENVSRIFGFDWTNVKSEVIGKFECLRVARFLFVKAYAEEVSTEDLLNFL